MAGSVNVIRLPDGRSLAAREFGVADGAPILFFHGTPGAGIGWKMFGGHDAASDLAIRLVAPDRPGMGTSDYQPRRSIGAWPRDVAVLADALNIDRFAVLGFSGGTGYAAACAWAMPDRVTRCALVASVCHASPDLEAGLDDRLLRFKKLVRDRPSLGRAVLALAMRTPSRRAPRYVVRQTLRSLPVRDREFLASAPASEAFIAELRSAFLAGTRGPQQDMALMLSPWDFPTTEIRVPVTIWQGTDDTVGATPAMAEHLHRGIPGSDLHLLPEGHLSVLMNRRADILTWLAT